MGDAGEGGGVRGVLELGDLDVPAADVDGQCRQRQEQDGDEGRHGDRDVAALSRGRRVMDGSPAEHCSAARISRRMTLRWVMVTPLPNMPVTQVWRALRATPTVSWSTLLTQALTEELVQLPLPKRKRPRAASQT